MDKLTKKVPEDKAFRLGEHKVRSVEELLSEMKKLSDEQFSHYVNKDHNYFIPWIRGVVNDEQLAKELENVHDRVRIQSIIEKRFSKPKEPEKDIDVSEAVELLTKHEKNKRAQKSEKHYVWKIAREFWYGLIMGLILGIIIAKLAG